MSYWGSPGTSPAWGPSRRGPSPVVPLLLVVALGWVICNETLTEWYEQVTEVQETVTGNAVVLTLAAGFLLLAAVVLSSRSEVMFVPVALVLIMLLIQNIMVTVLLLLLAAYFAGIYYYPPDQGYGVGGGVTSGEWGGAGLGSTCCCCCAWCCAPCSPRRVAAGGYRVCCWLHACSASTSSQVAKSWVMNTSEQVSLSLSLQDRAWFLLLALPSR